MTRRCIVGLDRTGQGRAGATGRLGLGCTLLALLTICVLLPLPADAGGEVSAGLGAEAGWSERTATLRPRTSPSPEAVAVSAMRRWRIADLVPDVDRACLPIAGKDRATPERDAIVAAVETVARSRLGAWLVRYAAAEKVIVCLDPATELEAHYRAHLNLIGLSSRLDDAGRVVYLAHELAHVPQHPRFSNSRRLAPADLMLLHRAREATAEAIATRTLWQVRQAGDAQPWRHKLDTAYGDIARRFEAATMGMPDQSAERVATAAAFHHWFEASWRIQIYDRLMLDNLAAIASDRIGFLPASRSLTAQDLSALSTYDQEWFLAGVDAQALIDGFAVGLVDPAQAARFDDLLAANGVVNSEPPGEQTQAEFAERNEQSASALP
jgi:hypothetical protein